ncbi:hypothetical protein T03_4708 [Trichinella britovi]|uniref:Uncharacterized protein n=1 Tax=Trichinella britovi TaxID=45882 RepID=A0A0V0YU11_TRIBR|nr:hypothetical protein T03_4708 [Trichinella britovi]
MHCGRVTHSIFELCVTAMHRTFQTRDVPLRVIQTKVVLSKKVGIRKKFDLHI